MRVIRAHDGVAFDLTAHHLQNLENLSALFDLLSRATQIDSNNIILMNALGSQLSDSLLRSILDASSITSNASSPPSSSLHSESIPSSLPQAGQLLYAFDRQFLSADPSETLHLLRSLTQNALEPPLQPYDPSADPELVDSLALLHHNIGSVHLRTTLLLLSHVRAQKAALEVALLNLDKCREFPRGALEAYESFAQPLVHDYGQLLDAFGPAFALAKKIEIHPNLLPADVVLKPNSISSAQFGSSSAGSEVRVKFMGDYVMEDRIIQIRDRCLNVYEDFRARFDHIRACSADVNQGALTLRDELDGPGCDLSDLYELEKDADEGFRRVEEVAMQVAQLSKDESEALGELFGELKVLDEDSRERIACLIERKNFWLHHLVGALNRISSLQGIIPTIGSEVQALNADLKTRTDSFRHLARLKDFVTAYAATVVEVVRRREFARHLSDYASALATSLAKLAHEERRRRLTYRSEYGGKMPFVVDGLDDTNVPTIEFEMRNGGLAAGPIAKAGKDVHGTMAATKGAGLGTELPLLTRADVDELIAALRKIEESSEPSGRDTSVDADSDDVGSNYYSARGPAKEVRLLVEKQYGRLEAMENAFAMAVERFVMSESESCVAVQPVDPEELNHLRARVAQLESANEALSEQVRVESTASTTASRKAQQDTQIQMRRAEDLKLQLLSVKEEARHERERLLQNQQSVINELGNAATTTKKLTVRIGELEEEAKARSKSLQDTERLVASARATADDATRELHELEARHRDQVSDHQVVLSQLDQARDRTVELEQQLEETRLSHNELAGQLETQKQMLESQATSAEQVRLKMEQEISELKGQVSEEQRQNDGLRNKVSQQQIEIEDLNQQLRLQAEAHLAAESEWKSETLASTARLERHCVRAAEGLQSYEQACRRIKDKMSAIGRPSSSQRASTSVLLSSAKATVSEVGASGKLESLPSPGSVEFEEVLENLIEELDKNFKNGLLVETVEEKMENMSSQIRKWMKQSKGYSERAKSCLELAQVKITFRDFAKGDLALFLPTRNPIAQVWAAFNVSFPHYFLDTSSSTTTTTTSSSSTTMTSDEQERRNKSNSNNNSIQSIIKNREWLVARILELKERVVDPKEPETNPYQLPPGTRYFLLQVEPWTVDKSTTSSNSTMSTTATTTAMMRKSQTRSSTATTGAKGGAKRDGETTVEMSKTSKRDSDAHTEASKRRSYAPAESPKPSTVASVPPTPESVSNTQGAQVDLTQSEFTLIEHLSSPPVLGQDAASDSPFRTALGSPAAGAGASPRAAPSGLALSLRGYHKSPPGSSGSTRAAEPAGAADAVGEIKSAFRPSESARPAFLASLSLGSAQLRRPGGRASAYEPPQRPRARPVPKAHTASRSSSRAPSVGGASLGSGVGQMSSPVMKALLRAGVQTSKGNSTVSTTFASMEKAPSSPSPAGHEVGESLSRGGGGQLRNSVGEGRVSFPGTTNLSLMLGTSGGSSTTSLSSLSGSMVGVTTPRRIRTRTESSSGGIAMSSKSPSSLAGVGVLPGSSGSVGGFTTGSLFGSWRRGRKESGNMNSGSNSLRTTGLASGSGSGAGGGGGSSSGMGAGAGAGVGSAGSSSSFVGASELLKRFSSSGGG